jgi:hypothetical protein
MRKVIQISTAGVENTFSTQCNHITTVLCDDGTVWEIKDNSENPVWAQLPEIPGVATWKDNKPYNIVGKNE